MSRLSDPARRALRTLLQVFIAIFGLQLLGWLGEVQEWASGGRVGQLPDPGVLVDAAVAGAAAAVSAAVSWIQNALEDRGAIRDLR